MPLRHRLDALRREAGAGVPAPRTQDDALRRRLQRLNRRPGHTGASGGKQPASPDALAATLRGRIIDEHLILLERQWCLSERHGRFPLEVATGSAHPIADLSPSSAYLDTETTGLAGGTGTVAFMVALGEVGARTVRLRQWLITAFAGERPMLEQVARTLAAAECVVTYNGAAFDLPLLRDRYRLICGGALPEVNHLDLLHTVRRLFRQGWQDCRLATAEENLLEFRRRGDLPGSEAPGAWRAYLAGDPAHRLAEVTRHNALDVLSLISLPPILARAVSAPREYGASPRAAAATWHKAGLPDKALQILEGSRHTLDARSALELARHLRAANRFNEAVTIWQDLARAGNPEATEHLAKFQEHVRKDIAAALALTRHLPDTRQTRHRKTRLQRRATEPMQLSLGL